MIPGLAWPSPAGASLGSPLSAHTEKSLLPCSLTGSFLAAHQQRLTRPCRSKVTAGRQLLPPRRAIRSPSLLTMHRPFHCPSIWHTRVPYPQLNHPPLSAQTVTYTHPAGSRSTRRLDISNSLQEQLAARCTEAQNQQGKHMPGPDVLPGWRGKEGVHWTSDTSYQQATLDLSPGTCPRPCLAPC